MPLEWDASEYEAVSGPQTGWGADFIGVFLERRGLRGDEAAIDVGCGTGRVTELLLRNLPNGTVLAVDASEEMVEAARRRFAGDPRVRVERRDVLRLEVDEPVDVIFSTATFHWIMDHERLFGRLAKLLKPGGRLVAQCGGTGNIARTLAVAERVVTEEGFRDAFAGWEEGWNFVGPEVTKLHEEHTQFASVSELARFLRTVVLKHHLSFLPIGNWNSFAHAVAERLAEEWSLVVDYVRLNMLATRSGSA